MELIDDKIMQESLSKFPGFCAKHLFIVLEKLNTPDHVRRLLELHKLRYGSLLDHLKEFCRKNDYRFTAEPTGAEAESWRRAVYVVSGKVI